MEEQMSLEADVHLHLTSLKKTCSLQWDEHEHVDRDVHPDMQTAYICENLPGWIRTFVYRSANIIQVLSNHVTEEL